MILILTDPLIGGAFLTWSLHYLAGHNKVFYVRDRKWLDLPEDPVNRVNAHDWKGNQPLLLEEVVDHIDQLANIEPEGFHTLYCHNFTRHIYSRQDYANSFHPATADVLEQAAAQSQSVILLHSTNPLYLVTYEERTLHHRFSNHDELYSSATEQREDFIDYFYKESLETWNQQGLNEIWDQREFLALNMRPLRPISIKDNVNLKRRHFHLNSFDLYTSFDHTLDLLFDHCKLQLDRTRLPLWQDIYKKWQSIHKPRMIFSWYLPEIVDYIINGHDMDLDRFNLDLMQEACIQHFLIYQHGLNLKTWRLDKFINTKQLHTLLEPNTHSLSEY